MIIYIHGFNSGANQQSQKVQALSKIDKVVCLGYDSFAPAYEISTVLKERVRELDPWNNEDVTFIGCSLGGFWAMMLGRCHDCPSIALNPTWDPARQLKQAVGKPFKNYLSGEENTLTDSDLEGYLGSTAFIRKTYEIAPLIILAMDDELLDSKETSEKFKTFPMVTEETGGHAYNDLTTVLPSIQSYIINASFMSQLQ